MPARIGVSEQQATDGAVASMSQRLLEVLHSDVQLFRHPCMAAMLVAACSRRASAPALLVALLRQSVTMTGRIVQGVRAPWP